MIKVALIGAGSISNVHSAAYKKLDLVKITAVVDINLEAAERMASIHGCKAYSSLDEFFIAETPDMVDICTSTYTHAELAIKALDRKIHVLCEKPMAIDMESAIKMVEAAERNSKLLMIAQVLRFWPEYEYLKKVYQDKTLGALLQANFSRIGNSPAWGGWFTDVRKSGLSPLDLHVHDTDFILYMLGLPSEVTSFGNPDDPKNNFITTRYHYNGMSIEAEGGWFDAPIPFKMSYRAIFEKGALYFEGDSLKLFTHGRDPEEVNLGEALKQETKISVPSTDAYYNEIKYFIDCIMNNSFPEISSPRNTLESLRTVFAEIHSARIGKTISI